MARFALPALALVLFACGPATAASKSLLAQGKAIASANCGACHAVGLTGDSPNPASPPFRTLARKYPLHHLEEALAEGIVVGHEGLDMPQFRFDAKQVEALLAYLGSIQKR